MPTALKPGRSRGRHTPEAVPAHSIAARGYAPTMRLSTRNQLKGTITEVDLGPEAGQPATVFIKSTEVTIGVQ